MDKEDVLLFIDESEIDLLKVIDDSDVFRVLIVLHHEEFCERLDREMVVVNNLECDTFEQIEFVNEFKVFRSEKAEQPIITVENYFIYT